VIEVPPVGGSLCEFRAARKLELIVFRRDPEAFTARVRRTLGKLDFSRMGGIDPLNERLEILLGGMDRKADGGKGGKYAMVFFHVYNPDRRRMAKVRDDSFFY